jgi:hypothetical protein
MELAMDSVQKGFRHLRRMFSGNHPRQQTCRRNSTDLSRVMVVMNQRADRTKASIKARRAELDMLGTFFDEEA